MTVYPDSRRYELLSDLSLIIEDVTKSDEGRYLCVVVPPVTINRDDKIDLQVIGKV